MAPTTPPRWSWISLPPVYPIKSGNKNVTIGVTILARLSFGRKPDGMNRAVINPHAMKADIFGMTIELRKLPNF
jgi:hypothetical protein